MKITYQKNQKKGTETPEKKQWPSYRCPCIDPVGKALVVMVIEKPKDRGSEDSGNGLEGLLIACTNSCFHNAHGA